MIILFGDSWARQSWRHSPHNINNGYRHWALADTWVINTDDWLNGFFRHSVTVNFARFGNTLDWIIRDLYHGLNTVSNLPERVDLVVFQTDPLRIFAPRQDYTDRSVVWPMFLRWCEHKQYDWRAGDLEHLLGEIYQGWYRDLNSFHHQARSANADSDIRLWLLGGVSRLHDCVSDFDHQIIMPSVSEHFGHDNDLCLENRSSLASFVDFWGSALDSSGQRHDLRQQWYHLDQQLAHKERFWIDHPTQFAGRHLTSDAMCQLAMYIEQVIGV